MRRIVAIIVILVVGVTHSAAREVVSLVDNWYFYPSTARNTDDAQRISLPHTWAIGSSDDGVHSSMGNYVRKLNIPTQWRDKRVFIKFYGVNSVSSLLVNGSYVGEHRGGATAFTFEITRQLNWNDENELQLVVDGSISTGLPPTSIDYSMDCGIYRPVELIATPKAAISPIYYGSDGVFVTTNSLSNGKVSGSVNVQISTYLEDKMDLRLSIFDNQGEEVFASTQKGVRATQSEVNIPFNFNNAKGWTPKEPNLYRFKVSLQAGISVDSVEVCSGLRVISTDKTGRISINSESVDIRGVLLYHDHPMVGSSMGEREVRSDMALVKELGATAVRSVSSPHTRELYDYCDREGVMAWVDFPLTRTSFLADIAYYPTAEYHHNAEVISREIVLQNYNHPSVIMWGLFSQLRDRGFEMISFLRQLKEGVNSIDSTRPIVAASNQNGDMNLIPDLIVWRQNLGWYRGDVADISLWANTIHSKWSHLKSAVAYGENGSINHQNLGRDRSFVKRTSTESTRKSTQLYDRDQGDWYPETALTLLHEEYAQRLHSDSLFWGMWLCNMFDYKSNRRSNGEDSSGLVTFDRRERKDIFYLYKSLWNSSEPTLHIAGRREWRRGERVEDLKIYSSSREELVVVVNESDTLSVSPLGESIYSVAPFELQRGVNTLRVEQGELRDSINLTYESIL
ncbi:MAG: glycoside hydrolase family 2 TIM barrel-domain containing protein [Rikenellaceae bacterium]